MNDNIVFTPSQFLPLRKMIEAMKADASIYGACPEIVQRAICDFYLPPYTQTELHIAALNDTIEHQQRLLDKFALKITELEKRAPALSADPTGTIKHMWDQLEERRRTRAPIPHHGEKP